MQNGQSNYYSEITIDCKNQLIEVMIKIWKKYHNMLLLLANHKDILISPIIQNFSLFVG